MIQISLVRKKSFNNAIQILIILCGVLISSTSFSADNVNSATSVKVEESAIKPLTKQEIDIAIEQMKTKLFLRVDQWNSGLGRNDFERVQGQLVLKEHKQQDLCKIFQGVIDETYTLAQQNRDRMTAEEKNIIDNRADFLKAIGFPSKTIKTKIGFNCYIK